MAYAAGHLDVTIEAWERAHAASARAGERVAAAGAAVRVAMHLLFDTALLAPVRGWLTRAERLLDGHADTPVHAWLGVVRSYERLLSGDFDSAREWARRAIDVGTGRDPAAAALGRVAEARSLILQGDVTQGLELLNEAAVATVSGEIDPISTGVVYCELVCALQALDSMTLPSSGTKPWNAGTTGSRSEAFMDAVGSTAPKFSDYADHARRPSRRPCSHAKSFARTCGGSRVAADRTWPHSPPEGRYPRRRGGIPGRVSCGWDPQPGLALVHLAHGEAARAAASIRDALDRPAPVPSKEWPPNTKLRRAPLLEAQVEIAIAAGDLESARSAADEIGRIAAIFQSSGMAASATLARGDVRLAEGDSQMPAASSKPRPINGVRSALPMK